MIVEAPGIEPGSENALLLPLRAYPTNYLAPGRARRRALLGAIRLFGFASRPVARRSASRLGHALPEAPAGLSVGRLSDLLFRQREQLRYRSQLSVPRRIYVGPERPRHAAKS